MKAKSVPESRSFASLVRENSDLQSLMLLHWSHSSLLSELSIPVYFSTPERGMPSKALAREAKKGEEVGSFTIERILHEAEPRIQEHLNRFINRLQASGVSLEKVDEAALIAAIFQALGLITAGSPLSAMLKLAQPFEDYFGDDIVDIGASLLSASKSQVLEYGLSRRSIAIRAAGLDVVSYQRAISTLIDEGFLKPLLTLFWCDRHKDVPASFYAAGHQRMPVVRCEICSKEMHPGTFLFLAPPAMTFVRHREGGMLYLMAWELERSGLPWNGQVYVDGLPGAGELDLVYQPQGGEGIVLAECKSYVTDAPDRTVQSNLKNVSAQMATKASMLAEAGVELTSVFVATNYPVTPARKKLVKSTFGSKAKSDLARLKVDLVGPGNLAKLPGIPEPEE